MPSIKVLAEGRRRTKPFHFGVWRNLVAHLIWVQGAVGSNPATPTADEWNGKPFKAHNLRDNGFDSRVRYCGCGRLGNAPDCGSGLCEFESRRSPHARLAQLGEHWSYKPEAIGSSPVLCINN